MMLTEATINTLQNLARQNGIIELYTEDSATGMSSTLRYKRTWAQPGKLYPRTESHMIFSVLIHEFVNTKTGARRDDPADLKKFADMVQEAKALFASLRQEKD